MQLAGRPSVYFLTIITRLPGKQGLRREQNVVYQGFYYLHSSQVNTLFAVPFHDVFLSYFHC